jgi:hypothetical protein
LLVNTSQVQCRMSVHSSVLTTTSGASCSTAVLYKGYVKAHITCKNQLVTKDAAAKSINIKDTMTRTSCSCNGLRHAYSFTTSQDDFFTMKIFGFYLFFDGPLERP